MSDYRVSVNTLVAFTARQGDLDLRFTPGPSAVEGMAGHAVIRQRRPANYESEVVLHGYYPGLRVSGRADGFQPDTHTLEEIKTHRAAVERIPENQRAVHRAQALIYGALLCETRELPELTVAVVYYHVLSGEETVVAETYSAEALQRVFHAHCERFLSWAEQETAHRARRDAALATLTFPYARYRTGQYELAAAVYRAARDGEVLLAQATTGIGKTLATLFPQLKALSACGHDRVFFLTAKTPGRALALAALDTLRAHQPTWAVRVLEYVARDKACVYPDRACHGDACPLAKGFYDRLPAARAEATLRMDWSQASVQALAARHQICPYYFAQELAKWSDVFVGDVNYYFDLSALLYAYTVIQGWRVTVLVDEAHNLIDRAREMYTARLDAAALQRAQAVSPSRLRGAFQRVTTLWHTWVRDEAAPYVIHEALPEPLLKALARLVSDLTDVLSEQPSSQSPALMGFYFESLLFLRLAESLGDHTLVDVTRDAETDATTITLRNLWPAPFLEKRFAAAVSTTLFSATLAPAAYVQDLLGLPANTRWLEVAAPFRAAQLQVVIDAEISTRYDDRARSLPAVVARLAEQYHQRPGNYLAFFSSYAYLQEVHAALQAAHPDVPTRVQHSGMPEADRSAFLAAFGDETAQIGFCVLGGAFSEGIDLPGTRLIGAFITTLGFPALSPMRAALQARLEQRFGQGFDYAYFYPGLQKVIQAAGRVIRSETDTGVVWLLDDRYRRREVLALLPRWWRVTQR